MAEECAHLDSIVTYDASGDGCVECLETGGQWVHLRRCTTCTHVGCCDSSPNHHATAHFNAHNDHPVMQSFEPGENWFWCFVDEVMFELEGVQSPSHI